MFDVKYKTEEEQLAAISGWPCNSLHSQSNQKKFN